MTNDEKEYQDYLDYQEYLKSQKKDETIETMKDLGSAAASALPMGGAILGGLLGAPAGPMTSVGAAGIGGAAGKQLEDVLLQAMGRGGGDPYASLKGAVEGVTSEAGGQAAQKALVKSGEWLYGVGLNAIDKAMEREGVQAIKKKLMDLGVTGNIEEIYNQIVNIGGQHGENVDKILQRAGDAGAKVSMKEAVAPVQELAKYHKETVGHPYRKDLVRKLETIVDDLIKKDYSPGIYKPAKTDIIKRPDIIENVSLPVQGESLKVRQMKPKETFSDIDLPMQSKLSSPSRTDLHINPSEEVISDLPMQKAITVGGGDLPRSAATYEKIPSSIDAAKSKTVDEVLSPQSTGPVRERAIESIDDVIKELLIPKPESVTQIRKFGGYAPSKVHPEVNIPEVPGVTPYQANEFKRIHTGLLKDKDWALNAQNPDWVHAQKTLAAGMREATEKAIGRSLGPEAEMALIRENAEWGNMIEAAKSIQNKRTLGMDPEGAARSLLFGQKYPIVSAVSEKLSGPSVLTPAGKYLAKPIDKKAIPYYLWRGAISGPQELYHRLEDK